MEYRNGSCAERCAQTPFLRCRSPCAYSYARLRCECDPYLEREARNAEEHPRRGNAPCPRTHKYEREDFGVRYCSDQRPPEVPVRELLAASWRSFALPLRLPDLVMDALYLLRHPKTFLRSLGTGAVAGVLGVLVTSVLRNACKLAFSAPGLGAGTSLFHVRLKDAIRLVGGGVYRELTHGMRHLFEAQPALVGVWFGALGATEERVFRHTVVKLMDRQRDAIEAIVQRALERFGDDASAQRRVRRVYGLLVCLVSSALFGLHHLQNLALDAMTGAKVACQVVMTTVMGIFLHALSKTSSLYSAWIAHFTHNFVATHTLWRA